MTHEQVQSDFDRALTRAFFRNLASTLLRQPNTLLPYHEVRARVTPEGESYRGMQTVPVRKIVGSADRYRDFDRAFLPRRRDSGARWKSINRAYYDDVRLPPVQLYKVGDVYFVKDGNHRVSVARQHGVEFIDAEVIEAHVRAPLDPSMSTNQLLRQVEYAEFLRRTNLDRTRPDHDIRPTALGRYEEILDHIASHREALERERGQEISLQDAATDWYDRIYLPIVLAVRDTDILREFPNRTEADFYLWAVRHQDEIKGESGALDPSRSARAYTQAERRRQPIRSALRRARLAAWPNGKRRRKPKSAPAQATSVDVSHSDS